MTRLLLWPMLAAIILFCGAVAVPRAFSHDDPELDAFFAAPDGCAMPCWAGIRPGVTRLDEALAILMDHPWVGHLSMEGELASGKTSALVWWHWNGQQSPYIDGQVDGRMVSDNYIVRFIVIGTRVPMGDAQAILGAPVEGKLAMDPVDSTMTRFNHLAAYDGITLQSPAACPVRVAPLWRTPVQIYLYDAWPGMKFVPYDLAGWLAHPPC